VAIRKLHEIEIVRGHRRSPSWRRIRTPGPRRPVPPT
jgi:hypothetical protein